ncbi:MAG: sigma-70 family RNA polymerase sigma factor [bacterium]
MSDEIRDTVTRILAAAKAGGPPDREVHRRLFEAVYPELRRYAANIMHRERANHTLQPTALVHEAYLKLVDESRVSWESRIHFLAVAGRAMRQILVDHARRVSAVKRGGGQQRVTLESVLEGSGAEPLEVLAVHDALERFAAVDERAAHVVELKIFAGLTMPEVAKTLGVSERTVHGDWSMAKMWLGRELRG